MGESMIRKLQTGYAPIALKSIFRIMLRRRNLKVGYTTDVMGNATEVLEIVDETISGMYVVRKFDICPMTFQVKPYVIYGNLQLRRKDTIKNIKEIELEGKV